MPYATRLEASTFCNIFNKIDGKGRIASFEQVGASFVVTITDAPADMVKWFYRSSAAEKLEVVQS